MKSHFCAIVAAASIGSAGIVCGQTYLMMPDSTNDRLVLLDPHDGSVVDEMFIDLEPIDSGTPNHAIQVGDEIWITDQIRDRIDRFTLDGTHLGAIGGQVENGGLDNIRGIALVGDTVFVANAGTDWGAPGQAVVTIDVATLSITGHILVGNEGNPWFILEHGDEILISTINDPHNIERHDPETGDFLGTFYEGFPEGGARFIQQIHQRANGNVLAAGFSGGGGATAGIWEIDSEGNEVGLLVAASGPRGVWELGDGNVLYTTAAGAFVYDVKSATSSQPYVGTGRMVGLLTLDDDKPKPCPEDLTGSGDVGVFDLLELLGSWGDCPAPCAPDLNGDGVVDVFDLLQLLAAWGECP